jgi:CIC family chloride channel protein
MLRQHEAGQNRSHALSSEDRPKHPAIFDGLFYTIAGLCGFVTGIVGAAFHICVNTLMAWPGWLAGWVDSKALTIVLAAVIAATAVTLAFVLTDRIAPEASGSGVPQVEGALEGVHEVRWRRVLPVKFIGGVLSLSAGLVGGREGPTIHMGAAIAAFLAERLRFMRLDLHTMLAAGAAAGLAAAFNAPLAAILFVVEETRKQFHYTFRSYVAVIIASAASAFAMELVGGTAPQLRLDTQAMPLPLLPVFVLLGAGLGVLGVVFNRTLVLALDWRATAFKRWPWLYPVIVGAAVGALCIVLPLAVRGGESLIPRMVVSNVPFLGLVLIALVRFVGTMASYPVGVPAGIFSPLLALATMVGLVAAGIVEFVLTATSLSVPPMMAAGFAVAAMGGLFSATIRAPLVGVVLVVELTGGYELILPTIITCVTAHVVAEELKGRPIYEVLLERALRMAGQEPRSRSTMASSPVGTDDQRL